MRTVLWIDDHLFSIYHHKAELERDGWTCHLIESIQAAEEWLGAPTFIPTLIILDMHMRPPRRQMYESIAMEERFGGLSLAPDINRLVNHTPMGVPIAILSQHPAHEVRGYLSEQHISARFPKLRWEVWCKDEGAGNFHRDVHIWLRGLGVID